MSPRFRTVLLALLALVGCKSRGGDGELRGVRYHVELEGSYTMVVRNDREQVWVPSDDDRPFVSIQVQPRPRADGTVVACEPSNHAQGTAKGGFYFVRKGDSVEMVTAPAPGGVVVSESRCIPPGEEALSCGANYADGQMPAEREARARAVCASLAVR